MCSSRTTQCCQEGFIPWVFQLRLCMGVCGKCMGVCGKAHPWHGTSNGAAWCGCRFCCYCAYVPSKHRLAWTGLLAPAPAVCMTHSTTPCDLAYVGGHVSMHVIQQKLHCLGNSTAAVAPEQAGLPESRCVALTLHLDNLLPVKGLAAPAHWRFCLPLPWTDAPPLTCWQGAVWSLGFGV